MVIFTGFKTVFLCCKN